MAASHSWIPVSNESGVHLGFLLPILLQYNILLDLGFFHIGMETNTHICMG